MKINKILLTCTAFATLLNFQAHASSAAASNFEDSIQDLRTQNQASQVQIQELTAKLAAADQLNAQLQAQLQAAPNMNNVEQLFLVAIDKAQIQGLSTKLASVEKHYEQFKREHADLAIGYGLANSLNQELIINEEHANHQLGVQDKLILNLIELVKFSAVKPQAPAEDAQAIVLLKEIENFRNLPAPDMMAYLKDQAGWEAFKKDMPPENKQHFLGKAQAQPAPSSQSFGG